MTDHSHVNGVLRCCCNGNRLVYELNQSIMGIKAHKREKELIVFKDNSSLIWLKTPFCSIPLLVWVRLPLIFSSICGIQVM